MAVSAHAYGPLAGHLANGRVDLDTDTFKLSLHTVTYTPAQDTDDFFDDATNQVANGSGYTTGGETITTPSLTYDGATNTLKWDGDDVTWATLTKTFRYGVIRKARGGAASADELIGWVDFGADQSPSAVDFAVRWAAAGILTLVVAA